MPLTPLTRGRARLLGVLTLLIGAFGLAGVTASAHAAATIWPLASSVPADHDGDVKFAVDQATGAIVYFRMGQGMARVDENGAPASFGNPALADPRYITAVDVPGFWLGSTDGAIAIDNSGGATQGDIHVVRPSYAGSGWEYTHWTFDSSGVLLSTVTRPGRGCGMGFDGQGDLWIGTDDRFVELTAGGTPTGAEVVVPPTLLGFGNVVCESAFDDAGNLYGYSPGLGTVMRFDANGQYVRAIANAAKGVVIDPESQNVITTRTFTDESTQTERMAEYDRDGVEQWRSEPLLSNGRLGLGKDRKTLVASVQHWSGNYFEFYGPGIRRPEVDAAGAVTTSSVTLTGTMSPGGRPSSYQFEYGTSKALGSTAPAAPVDVGSGTGSVTAEVVLAGLKPQAYYYFRLKATVGGTVVYGSTERFRTRGPVPVMGAVSDVASSSVGLSGTVDAVGLAGGSFHFLVTDPVTGFAQAGDERALPAGSGPQSVSGSVVGLPAGRTLTAQLVVSAGGVVAGSEPVRFLTPARPDLPVVPGPGPDAAPYGCTAPVLRAIGGSFAPGGVATVRGDGLGVGGTLTVGGARAATSGWSGDAVSFVIPAGAAGKLPVRVDCGRPSNSVELSVRTVPSNAFTVTKANIKGTVATLSVKLPGAGTLAVSGSGLVSAKVKANGARTVSAKGTLSKAGKLKLRAARSGALRVTVRLRYTPTGGSSRTVMKTITFKRGGAR